MLQTGSFIAYAQHAVICTLSRNRPNILRVILSIEEKTCYLAFTIIQHHCNLSSQIFSNFDENLALVKHPYASPAN